MSVLLRGILICLQGNGVVINKKVLFYDIIKDSFEALKDQPNIFTMISNVFNHILLGGQITVLTQFFFSEYAAAIQTVYDAYIIC